MNIAVTGNSNTSLIYLFLTSACIYMHYYGPYYTVVCLRGFLEYVHLHLLNYLIYHYIKLWTPLILSDVGLLAQSKHILGAHPKTWGRSVF